MYSFQHLDLATTTDVNELKAELQDIRKNQNEILRQLLYLKEDTKLLLAGRRGEIFNLRTSIPNHPIKSLEELPALESWLSDMYIVM